MAARWRRREPAECSTTPILESADFGKLCPSMVLRRPPACWHRGTFRLGTCVGFQRSVRIARQDPNRRARMRARYWRGRIWAARLGLLALALNALVPVHLAFDLAEA